MHAVPFAPASPPDCGTATTECGFSIVELIAVLLLLGILAATATSRLVGGNAYAPALVAQELVALGRLAQQTAMSRRDATVSLDVDADAGDWRIRVTVVAGGSASVSDEARSAMHNTALAIGNGATSLPLSASEVLHLQFDGAGGLVAGSAGAAPLDPTVGIAIVVTGDSSDSVCFGSAGHAYRGACS
jgi:prepilin-type N-terminal cleavage/methylation domain-containing protein